MKMSQAKQQKSPHKELKVIDEMEEHKYPDAEFKIMVIIMLKDLREE